MRTFRSLLTCCWMTGLVVTTLNLSGCGATMPAATAGSQGDIATASDETEVRKRARIRMELAATYFSQGQFTTALDELKQAEALDPSLPNTYEMRALIYDAMGDTARAEANFNIAVDREPNNGSVLHNYGWYLCRKGQYPAADAMFERASRQPQTIATSKTLLVRGVCQVRAGLFPEAQNTLARSYEMDPTNPATAFNLASVLLRRGELERARFYAARVNSRDEQITAESLWLAARIEHRMGNRDGVRDFGTQLRSRFPVSREANLFELGRFDD
jgi:type IV pilus assembly protein PilF